MIESSKTTRRNLLGRMALVFGGAIVGLVARREHIEAASGPSPEAPVGTVLEVHARHLHLYSQQRKRGEMAVRGDQLVAYAELLSPKGGSKVGEFYSSCLTVQAPFGVSRSSASDLQMHNFVLDDGSIIGMGATRAVQQRLPVFAIVGGTGRFAAARGTYTAEQHPEELGGDGTARFVFTLTG